MQKVYVKFPKVGLGNMLLVWARAIVFARLNNLACFTSSWWGLHWGALFRREKKKRLYRNYFIETPLLQRWFIQCCCMIGKVQDDPPVKKIIESNSKPPQVYLFSKVLTGGDVFGAIRDHDLLVKEELDKLLTAAMKSKLNEYMVPVIGVHIRRGDFKLGNQTTSLEYFIKGIQVVRTILDEQVPVTVFTDAYEHELDGLLQLPNISIAADKPDILDILLLSKSKIMILSRSSTFGYWAAYLSNAVVIRPSNDWQPLIKNEGNGYREIKWDYENEVSTKEMTVKVSDGLKIDFNKND
jgi:hypothetical protein